jgi:type I restriction enzyme, R subunit
MSNFQFLHSEWRGLYQKVIKAEERVRTEPVSTAQYCRQAMEEAVHHIYRLEHLELPYNTDLANLSSQPEFRSLLPFPLYNGLHIIRKTGNNASHYGNKVSSEDAHTSIRYLFDFLKWFAQNYSQAQPQLPGAFEDRFIPKIGERERKLKEIQAESERAQQALEAQLAQLQQEKEELAEQARQSLQAYQDYILQQEAEKLKLLEQKKERKAPLPKEFSEAQTRRHLIDIDLKEAGWFGLKEGRDLEFPVKGMPITPDNPKGRGYVDYVLWDDNGLPLALIEAKRTSADLEAGKHQAWLYANCLQQQYGQRPLIFYTNGYEIKLWDDGFYSAPRRVYGYYTKEELRWQIQSRQTRTDIRQAQVNTSIAGRPYQIEAIQRVAEALLINEQGTGKLKGHQRAALLVMATGSGKTRTAAALVDVLFKGGWAKRILFLADRNALVTQAKRAFGDYLPDLSAIDLTQEKENDTTRLVFSTYPSMMNKIDTARTAQERFYGVGHFDVIIIDEAHRSIYNRYGAIFEYFDALIIGLTATPKDNIDHNTFEVFGCSSGDPTFAYELEDAVAGGYLNPYRNVSVSTQFLREGIRYQELTDEEKARYEETFEDKTTGLFPEEISNSALNKWLFNKDTCNKVLDAFMQQGLKIEGGDKIGRTIIFAVNQHHAQFIVDCFQERYPQYPAGFIATIHNKVSHAQSLIDLFCDERKENNPQIAVSVDMMDTGIDAVRVLNLVFFKVVRSYAKFWQMIGRGTRLCPDVFGPGQPKEFFLIFDVCENFEFFEVNKKGLEGAPAKPVTQQLFESRLQLSRLLAETGEAENLALSHELLDGLHAAVTGLDRNRFEVQMHKRWVDEFSDRSRWNNLDADSVHQIEEHLSFLPVPETINETARRFDLMMVKMQLANLLMLSAEKRYQESLLEIAEGLSKKYTIPQVLHSQPLIEGMRNPDFYKELTQKRMNEVREEIRELVQYLENTGRTPIYSDIKDSEAVATAGEPVTPYGNEMYKKRVERFIRENKHHITISKLNTNQPITQEELLELQRILFDGEERGRLEDFKKLYGEEPLGKFIRSIVGLDLNTANQLFADFIQAGNLRADQITFINNIIQHLTKNGTIDKSLLFEPPFTDINDQGLLGVFDDDMAVRVIRILDGVNENAEVG